MRDFRDAKAMARTLRAALSVKGIKITISQSLELVAEAFGVADWNTLAAAIGRDASGPRGNAPALPFPPGQAGQPRFTARPQFSRELELTLHRAVASAGQRHHEYMTCEHLLLALTDDVDASAVMKACKVDLGALKENLTSYIDNGLKDLVVDDGREPQPTRGFERVEQRAAGYGEGLGRDTTGADFVVALFSQTQSPAVGFLVQQQMTQQDATNFILYGIVKGNGAPAA